GAADRGRPFAGALLRGLLVMTAQLHLAVDAFALQLLLERAQRLLGIIVANEDLHKTPSHSSISACRQCADQINPLVLPLPSKATVQRSPEAHLRRRAGLSRGFSAVQPIANRGSVSVCADL